MQKPIDILIERIAAKLLERNLSEREASIDATGKPDAIRYIRTRKAMPSAERLDQLAQTLGTTSNWLLGKKDAVERIEEGAGAPTPSLSRLARNLPVFGTALGADLDLLSPEGETVAIEQTEINMVEPQDFMPRPTALAGKGEFYVVTVAGDSMVPRFRSGKRLLVNSKASPSMGDDVIVQLRGPEDDGERVTAVLIKQLVRRKANSWVLRQFNPNIEFELPNECVMRVHTVIEWEDVLGI